MVTLIAIGKKHEPWVQAGVERYEKRLKRPFDVRWKLLPHSSLEGDRARQEESERLLGRIKDGDHVILLDETGVLLDSPTLATQLHDRLVHGQSVVCVIGGAYGVNETMRQRADLIWSLSPLVFPHQLVRLLLVEQLYRCQEIERGGQYHHE